MSPTLIPDEGAEIETWDAVEAELASARKKFPSNRFLLAALMEEVGELAQALMDDHGKQRIREEAVQVELSLVLHVVGGFGSGGEIEEVQERSIGHGVLRSRRAYPKSR